MNEYSEINFKKKFGQNFLRDKNLLASIANDAGVTEDDVVIEIGAGAGALTAELVNRAKTVLAFEIDTELKSELDEKFQDANNLKIIYDDFLNINEELIYNEVGTNFKVVANLPYYITTPILTKIFKMKHKPSEIVVMVQKEVGERIVATSKDSEYGYFSVFIKANADAKITRQVNRKMFTPVPNVDSCVIRLSVKNNNFKEEFFTFLKHCFAMKRKTLKNNIEKAYCIEKVVVEKALDDLNININVRADALELEDFDKIYTKLFA